MLSLLEKTISCVLSVSMLLSAWCFNFPGTASGYPGEWYGDINLNHIVDRNDAALLLLHLLRLKSFSEVQTQRADADRNGKVTLNDVSRIIGTAYNRYGLLEFCGSVKRKGREGKAEIPFFLGVDDLVVSPDGNDSWSGRLAVSNSGGTDGPLHTIERAKAILADKKDCLIEPVTVWLRGGKYILNKALNFGSEDASKTVYRAYPGEKPEITASGAISNWVETQVNGRIVWKAYAGEREMHSLYRGDETLPRSRYPKTGYFYVASVLDSDAIDPASWNNQCHKAFYAKTDNLMNFQNINDVDVRILHLWKDELIPLTGCNLSTGRVSLSKHTTMTVRPGDRYYYENVFETLSEPGEWYCDRQEKMIYYVPYITDSADNTVLRYGTLETILTMDSCADVGFSGIIFRDSEWSLKSNSSVTMTGSDGTVYTGLASPQAASDVASSIRIVNSKNIAFQNCSFINIGMTAVKFCENTHDCLINHCSFYNTGASAVTIYGDNLPDGSPDVVHNINVINCRIEKYGRVFNYATGILLIHANRCSLSNNEIHDGYYSGISAGWSWGYGYSVTHDLSICNNLIYNIGQGTLSDMGGIYTLGVQKGTVISGNIIHDVDCYGETEFGYGGWGLHLDEGTSYITVKNNLIYNCSSQGLHINYGSHNLVRNNIFALNGDGQVVVDKKEDHISMYFTHNIVVSRAQPIYNRVKRDEFKDNENLYWDTCLRTGIFSSGMQNYQFWETKIYPLVKLEGYYCNATVKDPLFADIDKLDFTVCPNSPALLMNFVPWDYSDAGINEN